MSLRPRGHNFALQLLRYELAKNLSQPFIIYVCVNQPVFMM